MKEKTEEIVLLGFDDADRRLCLTAASGGEGEEVEDLRWSRR